MDAATIEIGATLGSQLTDLLSAESIIPGSNAGYQTCKTIYVYHPLGAKMVDKPIELAQSQARELSVSTGPDERLVEAFQCEWKALGADDTIANVWRTARIYGVGSLGVGEVGGDTGTALSLDKIVGKDLYFSTFDPLNTAGSLVLNQDPNAADFQKPTIISVAGKAWHPSRTLVIMNEKPIYIEFTASAFGFVGRSVYLRALYPLKTFIQTMITDQAVTQKCGLLVWKAKAPGPVINNRIMGFFGWKRTQLQAGMTGNVLTVGTEDEVESLNFQNLEGPATMARNNVLKNIAMAAGMPAKLLEDEEMIGGMAEGTEDAKQIARYVDRERIKMAPIYDYFDAITMRRAWTPEFYETLRGDYPEYKDVPFETAFYQWRNGFKAIWPNLLAEPDSEKIKVEEVRFKSAVAVLETMVPVLDPANKAAVVAWVADEINTRRELFSAPLLIDEEALAAYEPPMAGGEESEEPEPKPFGGNT